MLTHTLRPRRRWLAMVLLSLVAGTADARIARNTIDPVAFIADTGRSVIVSGPITCTLGERAFLSATITQRSTGALAQGNGVVTCTGESQQWEVQASLQGREDFVDGPAIAVAVALTTSHGIATDAHQWLVNVTLETD